MSPKLIGGMFGIEDLPAKGECPVPFLEGRTCLMLSSARSGIKLLIDLLKPHQVWMPSYLCRAMTDAAAAPQAQLLFYEMDARLSIVDDGWLEQVRPGDLVVCIDYFGFPAPGNYMQAAKDKGALVLEDACQALLSPCSSVADFVLYSPRKFVGVPDGGILVFKKSDVAGSIRLHSGAERWIQASLRAGELRTEFDRAGADNGWFELFRQAESMVPVEAFAMSETAKERLSHYNYENIAEQRRQNYFELVRQLGSMALCPELPDAVVPLGFPLTVNNRGRIFSILYERKIYPPIHWPIEGIVPPQFRASHKLASEIMTLPCDQRYDSADMVRMSLILKSA